MKAIRYVLAAWLTILATMAYSQSVIQGGPWHSGGLPVYKTDGGSLPFVVDGGDASGSAGYNALAELGIVERGPGASPFANAGHGPYGTNACDYDAPPNGPNGYHYLCFSPNAQGGGLITYGAAGAASPLPFQFLINGAFVSFPPAPGGGAGYLTPQGFGCTGQSGVDQTQCLQKWASALSSQQVGGYCPAGIYDTMQTIIFNPIVSLDQFLGPLSIPPQTWAGDAHCVIRAMAPMARLVQFGSVNPASPYQDYIYNGQLVGFTFDGNFLADDNIALFGYANFSITNSYSKNALLNHVNQGDPNIIPVNGFGPQGSYGLTVQNLQSWRDQLSVSIASVSTGSPTTITTTVPHGAITGNIVYISGVTGTNQTPNCSLSGTTSALNCTQFQATVTGPTTLTLDGVTTVPGDWVSGGTLSINFSGSLIPIHLTSISQASPAVFTSDFPHTRQVGDQITIYADRGATYTDSLSGVTLGVDGVYTIASTPAPNKFTVYQHGTTPLNTLTPSNAGQAGAFFISPQPVPITGITEGAQTVVQTGIGVAQPLNITNAGAGYQSVPAVQFSGGGGTGAAGIAFVSNGVTGLAIGQGGSGYATPPQVLFTGGGGQGASATATLTGGAITGLTLTNAGNSYTSPPTVSFVGASTTQASATATISGVVYGSYISSQGTGYTSPPTVTFVGGSPTIPATATATLTAGNTFQAGQWAVMEGVAGGLNSTNEPQLYGIFQVASATVSAVTLNLNSAGLTPYQSGGILTLYPYRPLTGVFETNAVNPQIFNSTLEGVAIGFGGYDFNLRPYDAQLGGDHVWSYGTSGSVFVGFDIGGSDKVLNNLVDGPFLFAVRAWEQGNQVIGNEFDYATFGIGNTGICMRAESGSRTNYSGNTCQAPYAANGWTTQCQNAPCNLLSDISTAYLDPSVYSQNNLSVFNGQPLTVQPSLVSFLSGDTMVEEFSNALSGTNSVTDLIQFSGYFSISSTSGVGINVPHTQNIGLGFDDITKFTMTNAGLELGVPTGGAEGDSTINVAGSGGYYVNGTQIPQVVNANVWTADQTVCHKVTGGYGLLLDAEVGYAAISAVGPTCAFVNTLFYMPNTGGIQAEEAFSVPSGLRSGQSYNTDLTGRVTLSGGTATYVFNQTYASAPNCFTQDATTPANASYGVESSTQVVFHGTGTDVVKYACFGTN